MIVQIGHVSTIDILVLYTILLNLKTVLCSSDKCITEESYKSNLYIRVYILDRVLVY